VMAIVITFAISYIISYQQEKAIEKTKTDTKQEVFSRIMEITSNCQFVSITDGNKTVQLVDVSCLSRPETQ